MNAEAMPGTSSQFFTTPDFVMSILQFVPMDPWFVTLKDVSSLFRSVVLASTQNQPTSDLALQLTHFDATLFETNTSPRYDMLWLSLIAEPHATANNNIRLEDNQPMLTWEFIVNKLVVRHSATLERLISSNSMCGVLQALTQKLYPKLKHIIYLIQPNSLWNMDLLLFKTVPCTKTVTNYPGRHDITGGLQRHFVRPFTVITYKPRLHEVGGVAYAPTTLDTKGNLAVMVRSLGIEPGHYCQQIIDWWFDHSRLLGAAQVGNGCDWLSIDDWRFIHSQTSDWRQQQGFGDFVLHHPAASDALQVYCTQATCEQIDQLLQTVSRQTYEEYDSMYHLLQTLVSVCPATWLSTAYLFIDEDPYYVVQKLHDELNIPLPSVHDIFHSSLPDENIASYMTLLMLDQSKDCVEYDVPRASSLKRVCRYMAKHCEEKPRVWALFIADLVETLSACQEDVTWCWQLAHQCVKESCVPALMKEWQKQRKRFAAYIETDFE